MFARKVSVRSVNRPEALSGGSYFAVRASGGEDGREGGLRDGRVGRRRSRALRMDAPFAVAWFIPANAGRTSLREQGRSGWNGSGTCDRVLVLAARVAASLPALRRRLARGL